MVKLLNSSGLNVEIEEAVPTVPAGAWSRPIWTRGSVADPVVSPALGSSVVDVAGFGVFPLGGRVVGNRGTLQLMVTMGAAGSARTLAYLTDSLSSPANRIVVGIDASNRPLISIRNNAGVEQALVTPTYTTIASGQQVLVLLSWDSTQAIDVARFAVLQVNRQDVASGDWTTSPEAAWNSFQPTHLVLGAGVGGPASFNGLISSCQISNTTVTGASTNPDVPSHLKSVTLPIDTIDVTDTVGRESL